MPRNPRKISKSSIYHVMVRGNERKNIFEDDDDKLKLIDLLKEKSKKGKFSIYAYCLMDNHVHLIIYEKKDKISKIMQRINTSYAYYYNRKYKRVGHVFQDRFKSEVIEDERYLLSAIKYVHNNPIKANITQSIEEYKWSSYKTYLTSKNKFVDSGYILSIFSDNRDIALEKFIEFSSDYGFENFIDIDETSNNKMSDIEAYKFINEYLSQSKFLMTNYKRRISIEQKHMLIKELKKIPELSIRQIAQMLGISKSAVGKINA